MQFQLACVVCAELRAVEALLAVTELGATEI
jgi:hypothetical protein